jgi:hypothetical protein
MKSPRITALATLAVAALSLPGVLLAHITPPVVLLSERDAVTQLLSGARKFSVLEVRLSGEERKAIAKQWNWTPSEDFYRFYMGRDGEGRLLGAVIFVTDFTIHGPVEIAVGIDPAGTVRGAHIVEVTEETYPWVKPLLDEKFDRWYVGQDCRAHCEAMKGGKLDTLHPMCHFYAEVLASMVQKGSILYEVGVIRRAAARKPG